MEEQRGRDSRGSVSIIPVESRYGSEMTDAEDIVVIDYLLIFPPFRANGESPSFEFTLDIFDLFTSLIVMHIFFSTSFAIL